MARDKREKPEAGSEHDGPPVSGESNGERNRGPAKMTGPAQDGPDLPVSPGTPPQGKARSELARHLSDPHLGPRWQIARYKADHPDPFCKDIFFGAREPAEDTPPIDEKEIAFKTKVEQTLSTLKAIYRPQATEDEQQGVGGLRQFLTYSGPRSGPVQDERRIRFDESYERLFSLTVLGLATAGNHLATADAALDTLRADILRREAGPIKNTYMRKLGRPALVAATALVGLYLLYDKSPGFYASVCETGKADFHRLVCASVDGDRFRALFPSEAYRYRNIFLLLAGCMMGTWASFAARKVTLLFSDLAELEQDQLAPKMRLVFTGVLTFIFALVFMTNLVHIEIGGFSTKGLIHDGVVALLIGTFFGLLEQALPAAVMDRARGFVETINTK